MGLGTIVAGGGAALGTGAFSSVEADRTATISVADDANGFLSIEPSSSRPSIGDDPYLSIEGGQLTFYFDGDDAALDSQNRTTMNATGLNDNAITTFTDLITITNNGTNEVTVSVIPYDGSGNELSGTGFAAQYDPGNTLSEDSATTVTFEFDLTNGSGIGDVSTFKIEAK